MRGLVLGIETSIKNGSLFLLDESEEIDGWIGSSDVSRSEDLLPQIKLILERHNIDLNQIKKIAVSVGPGSFTGLRVGIATAKALSLAAGCEISGIPLLEAIAGNYAKNKNIAIAVSAGRGLFFWQIFSAKTNIEPGLKTGNGDLFDSDLGNYEIDDVLMESLAYEDYRQCEIKQKREFGIIEIVEDNFARLIALHSLRFKQTNTNILPLYVRPAVISKK